MKANFEIEGTIGLEFMNRSIDLHNDFDLVGFDYRFDVRRLAIEFRKSNGDWVRNGEFEKLIFVHSNVFFLNISYDNEIYEYPNDDKCIAGISFAKSSNREVNDEFSLQRSPLIGDDILYFFQSDHFIRVGCDKIKLEVV